MRIGIDAMGGDFAPREVIKGAFLAMQDFPDIEPVLFGQQEVIVAELKEQGHAEDALAIVHAPEIIAMDESPTTAIGKKRQSSIVQGYGALKAGQIDGFASAGNTGAMLVGAIYTIGTVPGVIRPTISSVLPKESGDYGIILDVGFNTDCKPDILGQIAMLGSVYAQNVLKIKDPKVGLLNIGEEPGKGNLLTQAAYPLLADNPAINFIGNVEGRNVFDEDVDVYVCDGFTGNVVLKMAEVFYTLIKKRKIEDEYFDRFNYEIYGGTPILGANAPVLIGHGISNAEAFRSMITLMKDMVESNLIGKFKDIFN
jgi:glycerol-3-phosphate acyltransferase PlsX